MLLLPHINSWMLEVHSELQVLAVLLNNSQSVVQSINNFDLGSHLGRIFLNEGKSLLDELATELNDTSVLLLLDLGLFHDTLAFKHLSLHFSDGLFASSFGFFKFVGDVIFEPS